jgi:RNA polymerase-binding protein DksA
MSHVARTVNKKHRVRERLGSAVDKYNPFIPTAEQVRPRAERPDASSLPPAEEQREALLALRARVQEHLTHAADTALSGYGIETTCASPDTADLASELSEQDLALSLMGNVNGTLEQIDAALQRVEEGTYGSCLDCDLRIPAARLEALPYARYCVQCAARRERRG